MTFTDANFTPLPFAKVFSYQALTTTPLALYATPDGSTPLPNPAICDASGRLVAYATIGQAYKLNVLDQNSVQVPGWPIDNIVVTPFSSPTLIASPEPTVAISNIVTDPGEPGTESLATSEQGMWERIKFVVREMKGTADYRTTAVQKEKQGTLFPVAMGTNLDWPDGVTSGLTFTFRVPYDYHSGPLSFTLFRRVTSGSGVAIMPYNISRVRDGQALFTVSTGNINMTTADTVSHAVSLSIAPADFTLGDLVKVAVNRLGADAGDGPATIVFDGHHFTYTGYASR